MENKNNDKGLVIILSIVIVVLIGTIIYMFVNENAINNNQNNNESQTEERENNDNNSDDLVIKEISLADAQNLFAKVAQDPVFEFLHGIDGEVKIDEMNQSQIGAFVLANIEESNFVKNLCGTETEKDLKSLGIIGEQGAGQYDCSTITAVSLENINEITNDLFGKTIDAFEKDPISFYYYEKTQIGIFRYATAGYEHLYKLGNYYITNDIVTIEAVDTNQNNVVFKFNFTIGENNYYLSSIIKG